MRCFILVVCFIIGGQITLAQVVNLKRKQVKVIDLLNEIKKQTGFGYMGDLSILKQMKPLQIVAENKPLSEVLKILESTQDISIKLVDSTIIISRNPNTSYPKVTPSRSGINNVQYLIKGNVRDSGGNFLQGATIESRSDLFNFHTASDASGNFTIQGYGTGYLHVRLLGYEPLTLPILKRSKIDIKLHPIQTNLPAAVVNTGYFQKDLESFTGSYSSISVKDLRDLSGGNILSTLQNLDPAFRITENNINGSNPNILPDISVRGVSNIGGYVANNPIFILNGFEVPLSRIYDLPANQIKRLSLLKDASATVLYGSRGGNGVVVIETVEEPKEKFSLSYEMRTKLSVSDLSSYNLMDAHEKLQFEKNVGLNDIRSPFYTKNPVPNLSQDLLNSWFLEKEMLVKDGVNTDWLGKALSQEISISNDLELSGKLKKGSYSIFASDNNEQGVLKKSSRERLNLSAMVSHRFNEKILISGNIFYQISLAENSPFGSFDTYTKLNPYWPLYDNFGELKKTYRFDGADSLIYNPLYNASLPYVDREKYQTFNPNIFLEWKANSFLKVRARLVMETENAEAIILRSPMHSNYQNLGEGLKGEYIKSTTNQTTQFAHLNVSYKRKMGKHLVNGGVVLEAMDMKGRLDTVKRLGIDDVRADINSFRASDGAVNNAINLVQHKRLLSLLGTLNYIYNAKYFADFSIRNDGSSRFGNADPYGLFWTVGMGYNLHQENFFHSDAIERLQFFFNVGKNSITNYTTEMKNTLFMNDFNRGYYQGPGVVYIREGNSNLKWPEIFSYSYGFRSSLWKDFLQLNVSMYRRRTERMITLMSTPPSVGLAQNAYFENIGTAINKGIEFSMTVRAVDNPTRHRYWSTTIFVNSNQGKLSGINSELSHINFANLKKNINGEYLQTVFYEEGKPLRNIKGVRSIGIDPSSGREMFLNKEGKIGSFWNYNDLGVVGNLEPLIFGGLNSEIRIGRWTVQVFFDYSLGADVYNSFLVDRIDNIDPRTNTDKKADGVHWEQVGDLAAFKQIGSPPTLLSNRFVETENCASLSHLIFHYDFKVDKLYKYRMKQLRINFTMSNLYRYSNLRMERGIAYPFARTFVLGATIKI
ncbi:SusC/RagA family TonB-linked outer membrane protein [Sphingobacterium paludis]|uniref:TonB-linked SusC/RagA family outer membrane protein n=1 Tax=Sphingobacterium paludis TaxID=1476465 RepID=A0A4R7CSV1_9SPHI|nr:SusC/RagA family TonB-linked outer membrane protein [Sphingobacterium paludis]TDS08907.1 TonB-linked SusC/RagA family outer membrane protein [Sphingobacterium paludis]